MRTGSDIAIAMVAATDPVVDGDRCAWLLEKGAQRGHRLLGLLQG